VVLIIYDKFINFWRPFWYRTPINTW